MMHLHIKPNSYYLLVVVLFLVQLDLLLGWVFDRSFCYLVSIITVDGTFFYDYNKHIKSLYQHHF